MIELRDGEPCDVDSLTQLVYESAPILLPYLFGSQQNAFDYISQAMLNPDGQYSARRHCVAANALKAEACVTLWHSHMPTQFHEQTLKSLAAFLQVRQLAHLVNINSELTRVFEPPTAQELCIGHLAVLSPSQGKGIGKKLVAYAIRQAKNYAKEKVVLDVDVDNEDAISFYRGCDFTEINERKFAPTEQTFMRMVYTI